jgi:hypothetical protein
MSYGQSAEIEAKTWLQTAAAMPPKNQRLSSKATRLTDRKCDFGRPGGHGVRASWLAAGVGGCRSVDRQKF